MKVGIGTLSSRSILVEGSTIMEETQGKLSRINVFLCYFFFFTNVWVARSRYFSPVTFTGLPSTGHASAAKFFLICDHIYEPWRRQGPPWKTPYRITLF